MNLNELEKNLLKEWENIKEIKDYFFLLKMLQVVRLTKLRMKIIEIIRRKIIS